MRVIDAEGRFVGFVKEISGQNLVIGRPSASEIQVPIVDCEMTTDKVKLRLTGHEVAQMGHSDPDEWVPTKYRT